MSLFTVNRHVGTTTDWRCKNKTICGATITTTTATDAIQDSKNTVHSHHDTHLLEIVNRRKVLQLKHSVVQDIHRPLKLPFSEAFCRRRGSRESCCNTFFRVLRQHCTEHGMRCCRSYQLVELKINKVGRNMGAEHQLRTFSACRQRT